ncbi:hypothetical protein [Streptomyces sp. NPDC091040]|uniref:hypothetical protein n=1 Tax=Streptomyces sp. NPDC091040 TaxID=3365972 RepID=UPI003820BA33
MTTTHVHAPRTPHAPTQPPPALPYARLLRAELHRLLSPKAVRYALCVLPALIVAYALTALLTHHTDLAAAQRAAEAAYRAYLEEAAGRQTGAGSTLSASDFYDDPRYLLAKASFVDLRAVLSALTVVSLAFGIHSGGADWSSRVILTLASVEPRRLRLFSARAVLTAAVPFVVTLLAAALLVPLLVTVAHLRGSLAGADAHFAYVLGVIALRGAAFVGLVALLGYGLAMLTRNTTLAFGIALAYLVAAERLFRDYVPALTDYHLSGLLFAVLNERLMMATDKTSCLGTTACHAMREGTTAVQAFAGIAVHLLPVVAAAVWRFTRRDIR